MVCLNGAFPVSEGLITFKCLTKPMAQSSRSPAELESLPGTILVAKPPSVPWYLLWGGTESAFENLGTKQ